MNAPSPRIVLIVDDDPILRALLADVVEEAGYLSMEACDSDVALAVLESRSDIGLLLTDVNMPGRMDGLNLAHATYKRWPSIKIIVVSGLAYLSEFVPAGARFFVKPYHCDSMLSEIRSLLGPRLDLVGASG